MNRSEQTYMDFLMTQELTDVLESLAAFSKVARVLVARYTVRVLQRPRGGLNLDESIVRQRI